MVSAPLDVIKTRIQNRNFDNPESGFRILTNMARNEGLPAFFKGLVPKVKPAHVMHLDATAHTNTSPAPHDRAEARVLILACANSYSGIRYDNFWQMIDRLEGRTKPSWTAIALAGFVDLDVVGLS